MILEQAARRLCIFAYYDAEGMVDDYVIYLLEQMRAFCTEQIVVVNGTLQPEAQARVRQHCTQLLMRENKGFDVTAYKEAFLQAENKESYDEVLFYNQTIFGPVCSLAPMFTQMAQQDVDFWGLTRHKGARAATWDNDVAIAPHIQSFFFAVRKSMFATEDFAQYWEELPLIETYWDAVSQHEVLFTEHFAARGYQWEVYVQAEDLEAYNDYPLMGMPTEMLERGCPFMKRKNFLTPRHGYCTVPQGAAGRMLLDYVHERTAYPVSYITQNLLRTVPVCEIHDAMTLLYDVRAAKGKAGKNVAVLWFAQQNLGTILLRAAQTLQKDTAMICLFATAALKKQYEPQLLRNVTCIVTPKNGAEYLFGTLWSKVAAYENVLYLHNNLPLLLGEFCDATTLAAAVESLIPKGCDALLSGHKEFGAVVPVAMLHQENLTLGINWPQLAPSLRQGLRDAGITAPLGENAAGFAVRGGMFFAKVEAVRPLAKFAFTDSHFTGENPAWEYLVPLAAQAAGLLTVVACPLGQAYTSLENSRVLVRDMVAKWATPNMRRQDQIFFRQDGVLRFYYERRHHMTLEQAFSAKLTLKQKLWICLQILLRPETFARLHRPSENTQPPPKDALE